MENYHESLKRIRHCSSKDCNLLRRQMSRVSRSDQSSTLSWESGRSFPISRILNLEPLLTSQNNCDNCDFDCDLRFLKIAKFKKKWGWKPNFERLKAKKKYCYHLHFLDTLPSAEFRSYIQLILHVFHSKWECLQKYTFWVWDFWWFCIVRVFIELPLIRIRLFQKLWVVKRNVKIISRFANLVGHKKKSVKCHT